MQHLCLASFTYYIAFIVHQCYSMQSYFNHFYGWKLLHCIDIHFIYLFINWWTFRLFPLFAMVNNAAMNISVQVCVCTCFIALGCIPIVKLQNHINISILIYWIASIVSSKCLHVLHSLQECMEEFQFSIILTNTCYFCIVLTLYKLKVYLFFFFFLLSLV